MNVFEAIKRRRSVKHFDSDFRIPDADLKQILSAGALGPTSFNMQNRQFIAVIDPAIKNKLMAASWGQEHIGSASVVVVIAGDFKAHETPEKFLRVAPKDVQDLFGPMVGKFYEGNDQLLRDEACRSVGLAGMNLMLAAQELGYESCPMIGFDPAQVSEIIGLSSDLPPLMLVTIGKGTQEAWPRLGLYDLKDVVSIDQFGQRDLSGNPDA